MTCTCMHSPSFWLEFWKWVSWKAVQPLQEPSTKCRWDDYAEKGWRSCDSHTDISVMCLCTLYYHMYDDSAFMRMGDSPHACCNMRDDNWGDMMYPKQMKTHNYKFNPHQSSCFWETMAFNYVKICVPGHLCVFQCGEVSTFYEMPQAV